jgi:hypothetical protein
LAGVNSQLPLNEFTFDPTIHDSNLLVTVLGGVTAMISGLIVRENPHAMRVNTPTATIGIRGTEFIVEVKDE